MEKRKVKIQLELSLNISSIVLIIWVSLEQCLSEWNQHQHYLGTQKCTLRFHPRPAESETMGMSLSGLCVVPPLLVIVTHTSSWRATALENGNLASTGTG